MVQQIVTIVLTKQQAEKLAEVLIGHEDEGPYGGGWQSDELIDLRSSIFEDLRRQGVNV